MKLGPYIQTVKPAALLLPTAIVLAAAIFIADTFTDLEIAVPVFYTAVILISARFCERHGIVLVGLGCVGLTLLSDLLTPSTSASPAGVINTVISVLAIVSTVYLVLKMEAAERSIYEARAQLTHAARVMTLGQLTASLAHEINQPVTATVANANASLRWLSANPPNLDEARTAIDRITKDMARAGAIVSRTRDLAKRAPARKTLCDVNQLISEIIKLTVSELEKHNINLRTSFESDLPPVNADAVQLQQVILNLMMNAIEAMDATSEKNRVLSINTRRENDGSIVVTFADSGPGLGVKNADQIFVPFYSTKTEGMGLGLTITRSIVENHDGRIWAENGLSGGAVFRFTLPITQTKS